MYSDRSWSYTTREYVNGSRIANTSISSSVVRVRLGIRVRYDPRVPDHSAFCWIAPLGIMTFRCFGIVWSPQNWTFSVFSPTPTWTCACWRRNTLSGNTSALLWISRRIVYRAVVGLKLELILYTVKAPIRAVNDWSSGVDV